MEDARSYYDKKSKIYDEAFDMLCLKVLDVITWKYLEPYIPLGADAWVLDAGGGTGRWAIRMAKKGCRVVLMDTSKGMLRVAAQKIRRENLKDRIILEESDITRTCHRGKNFDLVFCEHALPLRRPRRSDERGASNSQKRSSLDHNRTEPSRTVSSFALGNTEHRQC